MCPGRQEEMQLCSVHTPGVGVVWDSVRFVGASRAMEVLKAPSCSLSVVQVSMCATTGLENPSTRYLGEWIPILGLSFRLHKAVIDPWRRDTAIPRIV